MNHYYRQLGLIVWFAFVGLNHAHAEADNGKFIRVAVASNFAPTLKRLAEGFEKQHPGFAIKLSSGASLKLATQIRHGAPFDLLFAADQRSIDYLAAALSERVQTRGTYALGAIALIAPLARDQKSSLAEQLALIRANPQQRIAIANPKLAPYGYAAQTALQQLLPNLAVKQLVMAENIAQTFQFFMSANVDFAVIAWSQCIDLMAKRDDFQCWQLPSDTYAPIVQQVVLLSSDQAKPMAQTFLTYVLSAPSQAKIAAAGYGLSNQTEPALAAPIESADQP